MWESHQSKRPPRKPQPGLQNKLSIHVAWEASAVSFITGKQRPAGYAESAVRVLADMNTVSDEVLVARTCAGETAAYGALVSRYENAARVVALKYVRNHHVAEDVVQQAFLRSYEKLGTLRDRSRFGSWLMRIVQNEACNFATRSNHAAAPLTEATERELAADTESLDDETQLAVRLLNLLPEHERLVISLHYMDGHSVAEIAQMTGRPIGTITKQLSRATKRLQSQIKREESRR
jgi:RNA polymerase sigma-70 factor (ECF subfamily)